MKARAALALASAAAVAGVALALRQRAAPVPLSNIAPEAAPMDSRAGWELPPAVGEAIDAVNPWAWVEGETVKQSAADSNVRAFLTMIAISEGTEGQPDPYRVCYGYSHTIRIFDDHPAVTGEWRGARLPDAMCSAAGFGPGCVSTAAGRYQLIKPTWLACKSALALPDFGPQSQDAAAIYLIRKRGALDAVQAGDVAQAINLCRREWASLPGAGYGQPERKLASLLDAYSQAGGVFA